MRVHLRDVDREALCHRVPKMCSLRTNDPKKVSCKRCLRLLEQIRTAIKGNSK